MNRISPHISQSQDVRWIRLMHPSQAFTKCPHRTAMPRFILDMANACVADMCRSTSLQRSYRITLMHIEHNNATQTNTDRTERTTVFVCRLNTVNARLAKFCAIEFTTHQEQSRVMSIENVLLLLHKVFSFFSPICLLLISFLFVNII